MSLITDAMINAEMLVHTPLCTHREPKNILVLSTNENIETEIKRHDAISYKIEKSELSVVESLEDGSFDIVILDGQADAIFLAQINRVLNKEGLVVIKTSNKKELMTQCDSLFGIVMPYRYTNTKAFEEVVLASKRYHPTADIILQRSDLLDGHSYYNTEVHLASFALATYERKELAGIYKQ